MRSDQWHVLRDIVAFLVPGRPARQRTVLITGPVGIGRTSAVCVIADEVTEHSLLLTAAGSTREQSFHRGVIGQILSHASIPAVCKGAVDALAALFVEPVTPSGDVRHRRAMHSMAKALAVAATDRPIVVVVDDVHLADRGSLDDLGLLWRRTSGADVAFVVTSPDHVAKAVHPWLSEIAAHPRTRRVRLQSMGVDDVVGALSSRLGGVVARRVGTTAHDLTGGNPMLVAALAADQPIHAPDDGHTVQLVRGDEFCAGVVSCLHRYPPDVQTVGQALAALGYAGREGGREEAAAVVGRVLGCNAIDITRRIAILNCGGLVRGARFRCETAAAAVLLSMPPDEQAALRCGLGEALHGDGALSANVACLLDGLPEVPADWGVDVLQEAALDDLRNGRVETALRRLETAARSIHDPARAAAVNFLRLQIVWRIRPADCGGLVDCAVHAAEAGHLDTAEMRQLSWYLSWYGRTDRLRTARRGSAAPEVSLLERADDLFVPTLCDAGWGESTQESHDRGRVPTPVLVRFDSPWRWSLVLDEKFESHVTALSVMVEAERHDDAIAHCDTMRESVCPRTAPTWVAIALAMRAAVYLRTGALDKAYDAAVEGMAMLGTRGWGVALGGPLAVAVMASSSRGRHGEVATLLGSRLPNEIVDTRYGIAIERARGLALLALGRAEEAQQCFLHCRSMIRALGVGSSFVPWRTDLAQAYLDLGERDEAHRLARSHLELSTGTGDRARGLAVHVFASTLVGRERVTRFGEAAMLLESAGDRFNQARSLTSLAHAHQEVGDQESAQIVARHATTLARWCGAETLLSDPMLAAEVGIDGLTAAEHRIASLASEGHSNKMISEQLFITVSTVEQHLTRVYRKLGIARRGDLQRYPSAPRIV